jgi:exopolysaccharide production protein ExoY
MECTTHFSDSVSEKKSFFNIYNILKRCIDVTSAVCLLILFSPILLLLLLYVFFETKSNPIFVQYRALSLKTPKFKIYKIRTIISDRMSNELREEGVFIKNHLEKALTGSGRFLRSSGLDELPQLINIIKGDMSFIGPRPLSISDLEILSAQNNSLYTEREMIDIPPGITGYWQIFGIRSKGLQNLIELDNYYFKNRSIRLDIYLLFKTIPVMIFRRHTDAIFLSSKKCS